MAYTTKQFIYVIVMFCFFFTKAQNIEVKGIVLNEVTKTPVEFATIQIESTKNNRLLGYGFSDEKGAFTLDANVKNETDISIVITYIGFVTHKAPISVSNHNINVGKILLHESTESLDEIVITAKPAVLIKKDTIQYNASSFKTKEDAVAEDLLKKLPGVSIDNDTGIIQVNGVDVTKILVNGEPFFTDNPKVAMKILAKDVIEKIEITNTRSDEENFTDSPSSEDTKTINITLKKKDAGNLFGNASGGYGTNDRYETNGVLNRVHKKSLLTVLAFSNNVNKNNFSYNDDEDNANTLDGLKAIKTETNIGTNYSDKFKNGDKLNFDYTYSDREHDIGFVRDDIILLPNGNNFSTESSEQINTQKSHRGNLKLINTITKNFRLITNAKIFKRDRGFNNNGSREINNSNNQLINTRTNQADQEQDYQSLNSSISGLYKIPALNSYFNLRVFTTDNIFASNSLNQSETNFTSGRATFFRNQLSDQNRFDDRFGNSLKFGQRFKKYHTIEYQFTHIDEKKEDFKDVFDIDNTTNTSTLNNNLSFNQRIDVQKQEHQIGYTYKKNNLFYTVKFSKLSTELSNREFNRDIGITKDFNDFLIFSKLRYKTQKGLIINGFYRTKSIIPRNNELLAITNNANPLRITLGNADLKRELEHLLVLNLRYYNRKNKIFFFNRFRFNTVEDKIINQTTVDSNSVTTRTYVNNSDNYQFIVNGSLSKDYKQEDFSYNFKVKWHTAIGSDFYFVNNESYKSQYQRLTPSFFSEVNYRDLFEISPYYRLFLDNTEYNTDLVPNQSNIQHTFGLNLTTFAPKRFTLFNQLQYTLNPKFDRDNGRKSLVWNITANYSIVPNKAKLKLTLFNILDQYNNVSRRLTESRTSTINYDVLQQYAMLSFKYIFKN